MVREPFQKLDLLVSHDEYKMFEEKKIEHFLKLNNYPAKF